MSLYHRTGYFHRRLALRNSGSVLGRRHTNGSLRRGKTRRPRIESLEERALLAGLVTIGPNRLSSGAGLVDNLTELLPVEIRDALDELGAGQLLDLVDSGTVYQAFPGESNDVSFEGDLGNFLLLFSERPEVTVGRFAVGTLPPVGTQEELLDMVIPDFEFGLELGGDAGPVIVEVGGDIDFDISITGKQIRELIKQFIDFGGSRSVVYNATALLDLIPDLSNLLGVVDNVLDFDIADILPTIEVDPIVDIDLPFGLPDIEIPPSTSADITGLLEDSGIPTSFTDLADLLPGPVGDALGIIVGALDFLKSEFISDSIFVSTLDRGDNIDFSGLTGIPVQVYAGSGPDTITPGGSSNIFDSIFDTIIDPLDTLGANVLDGLFDNNPARIELFGEEGTDTFVINRGFNSLDTHIDGGDANDEIIVNGTAQADIIEIIAGEDEQIEEIRYFIPDPNGGTPTNETQQIALPPNTNDGDFTLTFTDSNGLTDTTGPIDFDANGSQVESALAGLASVGSGNVAVSGTATGPWTVTFRNVLGESNQRLLVPDSSGLVQAGGEANVQIAQQGDPTRGDNQIQQIDLPPNPISSDPTESPYISGGTFTINFNGQATEAIPFNANGGRVGEALEALDNLEPGQVSVSGGAGGPYSVEFIGDLALTNQPQLSVDGTLLTGGVLTQLTVNQNGLPSMQTVSLPDTSMMGGTGLPLGNTFTLSINGNATAPLPANVSSTAVQNALAALPGVGTANVFVSGPFGGPYEITLSGSGVPNGGVTGDASQLSGGIESETNTTPNSNQNEVQTLDVTATSGTYQITVDNGTIARTTNPIPHDATVSELQAALEDLGSIGGPENLIISGSVGSYVIEFTGDLAGIDLPEITVDTTGLNAGATATPDTMTEGVTGANAMQNIVFSSPTNSSASATSGDFTLTYSGETTAPLPFDATPAQVQQGLELLPSIQTGQLDVTGSPGNWTVEFIGRLAGTDPDEITGNTANLVGGFLATDLTTTIAMGEEGDDEVQSFTFDHQPAGGDFLAVFNGETSDPIPFNASATDIQTALEGTASIGSGNVTVSSDMMNPETFTVNFQNDLAATDTGSLFFFTSGLSRNEPVEVTIAQEAALQNATQVVSLPTEANGGDFTITLKSIMISETTAGDSNTDEQQTIMLPANTTDGDFTLTFEGAETGAIPFDADGSTIQTALQGLSSIAGAGNVMVTGPAEGPWVVKFQGSLENTNVDMLTSNAQDLIGDFTTTAIPYNASVNQVAAAIQSIDSVGTNVRVTAAQAQVEQNIRGRNDVNEMQSITLPLNASAGTFDLTFKGATTATPIDHDATEAEVETALESLSTIDDVTVMGNPGGPWTVLFIGAMVSQTDQPLISVESSELGLTAGPWTIEFIDGTQAQVEQTTRGEIGIDEEQVITLPANTTAGTFTVTFNGETTAAIAHDADTTMLETALEALLTIDDVTVTGGNGGPWTVLFTGAIVEQTDLPLMNVDTTNLEITASAGSSALINSLGGKPIAPLTIDGTNLMTQGNGEVTTQTLTTGGGGNPLLVTTKHFNTFVDVEHLRIDTGAGDDHVILRGVPNFPLGTFYAGGEGNDTLEIISTAGNPNFVAPVFPNDDGATVMVDEQAIQFDSVEGGLTFNANDMVGMASLSGNDAGNELRFAGVASSTATFAMDSQVTITLANFADGSSIELLGAQGDDQIAVALNGVTEFSNFTINGNGPAGQDSVIFEGTTGQDDFTFTPGLDAESGTVLIGTTMLSFNEMSGTNFLGRGGLDSLTVLEPQDASNDTILFNPQVGNNGSFQYTTQSAGPGSTLVYPVTDFSSIETRTFNTGTGIDTLSISSDDLPGVNSSASVDGGNGTVTASFGNQATIFIHDIDPLNPDIFSFEIGTAVDDVTVAPGVGVDLFINTALGTDTLIYQALAGLITVDLEAGQIAHPDVGDVFFTSVEVARIEGNDDQPGATTNELIVVGTNLDDRIVYTPLAPRQGRLQQNELATELQFQEIGGDFTITGADVLGDEVVVVGSANQDSITLDGPNRTATVVNALGVTLKPVILGGTVELATLLGGAGSDNIAVIPAADLLVQVDGGNPQAAGDRLVVIDQETGDFVRHHQGETLITGTVIVGALLPIAYDHFERVDIQPLDPVTGGTGTDGGGQIMVFHFDQHEQNDSFLNPTEFADLEEGIFRPNIDPGGLAHPFAFPLDVSSDEDWYRFTAPKVGSFRFEVIFDAVAALPGGGDLDIELYDEDMALIAAGTALTRGNLAGEEVEFEVNDDQEVYLRVRGASTEAINVYDVELVEIDLVGPRVTGINITDDPNTPDDESEFNLFEGKTGSEDPNGGRLEPTPLINSLTINLEDLITRPPGAQDFVYPALDLQTASSPGHYLVEGDNFGIIPIQEVIVTNETPVVGTIPTGTVELVFFEPLPDDRFTLTVSDMILDPAGNQADGETNTLEPQAPPALPSGDGQAGGDFEARFTVDSRAEVGVWAAGSVYVDTNGNAVHDPSTGDFTNRDITYTLGFTTDTLFAGNFFDDRVNTTVDADGFDKLASYGSVDGRFRWQIDVNNDGVIDLVIEEPQDINGLPVAGNFDGNPDNGDEVGLLTPTHWWFDTDHDFQLDTSLVTNMVGYPVVGDFDGDGADDLATLTQDFFSLDLSSLGGIDGQSDLLTSTDSTTQATNFRFGFPGPRDRPVAADFDGDGIDDLGLWVPDRNGATPQEGAEWYVFVSNDRPITDRIVDFDDFDGVLTVDYTPDPFGKDLFIRFGDEFAQPVVGNFDPPVTPISGELEPSIVDLYDGRFHNDSFPLDVDDSGTVTLSDALTIVSVMRSQGSGLLFNSSAVATPIDVNADGSLSLLDALEIVSYLRNVSQGEGEALLGISSDSMAPKSRATSVEFNEQAPAIGAVTLESKGAEQARDALIQEMAYSPESSDDDVARLPSERPELEAAIEELARWGN